MRILVYGAGVIGSLYAARLRETGHDVVVLARGSRYTALLEHGIQLQHAITGERRTTRVSVIDVLRPGDAFDLALVAVRRNDVDAVLPVLAATTAIQTVLFMVHNASGYERWSEAVGRERLLVGFPGAGGTLDGATVTYVTVPGLVQPTTFGEPDGAVSGRLRAVAATFRGSGFSVAITKNMDAWQKTHVAWVTAVANALYMANGDPRQLARTPEALHLLVRSVREGFRVLKTLGIPVTPVRLRAWEVIPAWLLTFVLGRIATTRWFEVVVVRHANAARDEMRLLATDFNGLARQASIPTPATDTLLRYL